MNVTGSSPQSSSLWILPTVFNGTYFYRGAIPSNNTNWNIAEWNFPNQLPLDAIYPNQTAENPCIYDKTSTSAKLLWYTLSSNGIVCVYDNELINGSKQIELNIIGTPELECGIEMDLFVQPNQPPWYNYPLGFIGTGSQYPYLGQINSLNLKFEMEMIANPNVTFSCGKSFCGQLINNTWHLDYGYAVLGIILNSNSKQTIFYQISLEDTRQNYNCSKASNVCSDVQYWYFVENPYGVTDSLPVYGYNCFQYPSNTKLKFDENILQRLIDTITGKVKDVSIPNGLDENINNWQVSGFYIGTGVQGVVRLTYLIHDISLIAVY